MVVLLVPLVLVGQSDIEELCFVHEGICGDIFTTEPLFLEIFFDLFFELIILASFVKGKDIKKKITLFTTRGLQFLDFGFDEKMGFNNFVFEVRHLHLTKFFFDVLNAIFGARHDCGQDDLQIDHSVVGTI